MNLHFKRKNIPEETMITKNCDYEKLLGIKIDSKLRFDNHVQGLCKKANAELRALAHATSFENLEKGQKI